MCGVLSVATRLAQAVYVQLLPCCSGMAHIAVHALLSASPVSCQACRGTASSWRACMHSPTAAWVDPGDLSLEAASGAPSCVSCAGGR